MAGNKRGNGRVGQAQARLEAMLTRVGRMEGRLQARMGGYPESLLPQLDYRVDAGFSIGVRRHAGVLRICAISSGKVAFAPVQGDDGARGTLDVESLACLARNLVAFMSGLSERHDRALALLDEISAQLDGVAFEASDCFDGLLERGQHA